MYVYIQYAGATAVWAEAHGHFYYRLICQLFSRFIISSITCYTIVKRFKSNNPKPKDSSLTIISECKS